MSEIANLLRKEAEGFQKQADYLNARNAEALKEIGNALNLDFEKSAENPAMPQDNAQNMYQMMDQIKNDLSSKSLSPQFSMQVNQARTPSQLLDLLQGSDFTIRKTASEETVEQHEESSEDTGQEMDQEQVKQAAINELVEKGVDHDQAVQLVEDSLNEQEDV